MDEQKHTADELEIDIAADEVADTTATDTGGQETEPEDKQEQDALDLEEKPKEMSKVDAVRNKQAEAWAKKIINGAKTIDEIPSDLNWLKPLVQAKLGTTAPDLTETVASAIKSERETQKFQDLQDDCKELPKDKKVQLKDKFNHFRSKGLSQLDALETAMEALNINPEEDRLNARRQASRLRTPGKYKVPGKDASIEAIHEQGGYAEVHKNFSEEQRLEYLLKLRGVRR